MGSQQRRVACLALAILALPWAPALAQQPSAPGEAPDVEQNAPGPDGTPPLRPPPQPDKTQPPWSQTPTPPIEEGEVDKDVVAGGRHWRIGTGSGVVHVWRPQGYAGAAAGTVVYLHGYYTNVDQAWVDQRLAEQFRDSQQNALFIVPESPASQADGVFWKDLGELLRAVSEVTRLRIPPGPLVVMGHSGACRTLIPWLAYGRLEHVVLIDAMYSPTDDAVGLWLRQDPRPPARHLLIVGLETEARTFDFLKKFPRAVRRKDIPTQYAQFTRRERLARILYLHSDRYDHFELVTRGEVIPLLLRLMPLKHV